MKTTFHTQLFRALLVVVLTAAATSPAGAYDFMVDGIAYNINEDSTSVSVTYEKDSIPFYSNLEGHVVIPSIISWQEKTYTVNGIGDFAFLCCDQLSSIEIPKTVSYLGNGAFYGCTALSYVIIPELITTLNNCVFAQCTNLEAVLIPSSVNYIYNSAFYGCSSLKTIVCDVENPLTIWQQMCMNIETNENVYLFGEVDKATCKLIVPKDKSDAYRQREPWQDFLTIIEKDFGDSNLDGGVTVADVTVLYNYLLNGDGAFILGDVNGDGSVTTSDITVIYNIILNGIEHYRPVITLEGERTMILSVGETYVEPGYKAEIDGEDITNDVNVASNIDTSKPGFYTVTYSVVTSEGIYTSVSRNVMVNNPGHFNNIYWGECWHKTSSQRHFYNSPIMIEENDASEGHYTINDVLGGYYCYGMYPQYLDDDRYNFFVEALLKLDGTSVTMLEESDNWYFYDSEDPLEMLDGQWNPETGTITYRMNYYAGGGVVLTPIDETNIGGVVYDNNSEQE